MDEQTHEDQRFLGRGGVSRRSVLSLPLVALSACGALPGATRPASSQAPDLTDGSWRRRLIYAAGDAELAWSILGRKYGLRDNRLTPLWDTNTVAFSKIRSAAGGAYAVTTLEVVFYTVLNSEEKLETWVNPYTNEQREVMLPGPRPVTVSCDAQSHCRRDLPANLSISEFEDSPVLIGNSLWAHSEKKIEVRDGESGRPVFSSTEFLAYQARRQDLENEPLAEASMNLEIISQWLPWMGMEGQSGGLYTRASGSKLASLDDMPKSTSRLLRSHFPEIAVHPFDFA